MYSSWWDLRAYSSVGAIISSLWHTSLFSLPFPIKENKLHLQLGQSLGVWSRSIACWLCSQGKMLPLFLLLPQGKAALGTAQLLLFKQLLPKWVNCEIWHWISQFAQSIWSWTYPWFQTQPSRCSGILQCSAWAGFLAAFATGGSPWVHTIEHHPTALWGTVRSATCSIWFSHHNHDDFSLLSGRHEFRLRLIYFPAILTLNLTQMRAETDTMSKLVYL